MEKTEGFERKPGWYSDGPAGVAQWWDGAQWRAPQPGDRKAAEKEVNGRVAGRILGWGFAAFVVVFAAVAIGQQIG